MNKFKGVLVDSNLLLLLFVGLYDSRTIARVGRLRNVYDSLDFKVLFEKYISPNDCYYTLRILAEVYSLSKSADGDMQPFIVSSVCRAIAEFEEIGITSSDCCAYDGINRFGFTDVEIIKVARDNDLLVITDDLKLQAELFRNTIDCLNMRQIRNPHLK